MNRVLFLAYLFPPIANSGTQRPLKFAKYLGHYGWEPTVLTTAGFEGHVIDSTLLADIPSHVRVVRVPMLNEQIGNVLSRGMGGGAVGKRVGDAVRWRMQNRFRTPDLYACWRRTARRAALRIYRESGFDAVYATGFPWTSLLVGCDVARATGRPLVADFRDLWAGETLFREHRPPYSEELSYEGGVIECAKRVVTTSMTMSRALAASHPGVDGAKLVTIHNGFDSADIDTAPPPPLTSQRFRIVFTGVWKDGYNPGELYDSFDWIRRLHPDLLDKVELIAAGFAPGEAHRRGLGGYIKEPGVLSHAEAVALMRSANIVYLSHGNPDRQWVIPGKLYEYLASGTPVLALTDPEKETAQIIRNVGGGIAVSPSDPDALNQTLIDAIRRGSLTVPPRNSDMLASFERRQLTKKLADVLNSVSASGRAAATVGQIAPPPSTAV